MSAANFVSPLMLCLGLLLLYAPSAIDLYGSHWSTDQNAHGPLVLIVSLWLLTKKLKDYNNTSRFSEHSLWAGSTILGIGLLFYVLGRSQGLAALEVASFIFVLMALCAFFLGTRPLRYAWFPFLMMFFAVPLPGSIVDALTQPLKITASVGAEQLLFWLGYPIARSGVTLIIGQYQLLVADACAGLNSLFTLEALGLLYLNLVHHSSVLRTAGLAILIVPISLASNIVRVSVLAMVTYHYGDAAGQGFVHDFSGIVLFLVALLLIISMDGLLRGFSRVGYQPSHA